MASRPNAGDAALPDPRTVDRSWLKRYPPGVPPTYGYADVPVTRFLDDAARDFPTAPATWFDGVTIDHEHLRTQVIRFAAGLRTAGVSQGDRVALSCGTSPAFPIALFATLRLGAVAVLVDPDDDQAGATITSHDPVVAIGEPPVLEALGTDTERVAVRARDWLAPTRRTLVSVRRWWSDRGVPGRPFRDLVETGVDVAPPDLGPDAPALIVHEPGGPVVHTHASLVAGAFQARLWIPDTQAGRERLLVGARPTGAFGLVAGIFAGVLSAAMVVLPRSRRAPDVADAARRARPGLCLLDHGTVDELSTEAGQLSSMRVALTDGSVSQEAVRRFESLGGVRLRSTHGVGAAGFALAAPVYGRTGPEDAVLPVTDTVAVVVDDADPSRRVPHGEVGRLAVHGPQLSPDLAGDGGWFVTSDLATQDAEGWLRLRPGVARTRVAGGAA